MSIPLTRRFFLKAAGVSLALPSLEAFADKSATEQRLRMVAVGIPFGFDPINFIPTTAGKDYTATKQLKYLDHLRNDYSIISGLSHPNTGAGNHKAEAVMLTGAPYPNYSYNLKNTISVDQAFATHFRGKTRIESLVLGGSISYTSNGVAIPAIKDATKVYEMLFTESSDKQKKEKIARIKRGQSMLDLVTEQTKKMNKRISTDDRVKVDQYFTALRDVERQLEMSLEWVDKPKPKKIGKAPKAIPGKDNHQQKLGLLFDMAHLALTTDSTRSITIRTYGHRHDLSHHGKEKTKRGEFIKMNGELLQETAKFLGKMKSTQDGKESLLDQTMFVLTSNLRDGNTHWTSDLPVILAGGGFNHGQHLNFNPQYLESLKAEIQAEIQAKKDGKKV